MEESETTFASNSIKLKNISEITPTASTFYPGIWYQGTQAQNNHGNI